MYCICQLQYYYLPFSGRAHISITTFTFQRFKWARNIHDFKSWSTHTLLKELGQFDSQLLHILGTSGEPEKIGNPKNGSFWIYKLCLATFILFKNLFLKPPPRSECVFTQKLKSSKSIFLVCFLYFVIVLSALHNGEHNCHSPLKWAVIDSV